ncbi:hypothetical protein HD806DRAFT_270546 [Xylariaceae sp. AK1471]|nr:hypothetical protein HD806DRAFT_270546 [Xylariaceae sp. AK1471]
MGLIPPDPRKYLPSRAHPEHRQQRKQLEKEHPFGLTQVAALGLIGLTLAWDIEKQVQKHEEKKDKEEAEQKKREDREGRRRAKSTHSASNDHRRDYMASKSNRASERRGGSASESYARDPRYRQSVVYRVDPKYDDRYRDQKPRHDLRENYQYDNRRYDSRYDDLRDLDQAERGRSRRDSW